MISGINPWIRHLAPIFSMCILITDCSPATSAVPSATPVVEAVPTSAVFPTEIYPDPVERTGTGAAPFEWCPNPAGIENSAGFPIETAIGLINNLHSGDSQKEKLATDPSAWPMLDQLAYESDQIDASWFDGPIQAAAKSPYAEMLAAQCGQEVINRSWTARICPGPCTANSSESLKEDYFFLWRAGSALIWIVWP